MIDRLTTAEISRLFEKKTVLKDYEIAEQLAGIVINADLLEGLKELVERDILTRAYRGNTFEYTLTERGKQIQSELYRS